MVGDVWSDGILMPSIVIFLVLQVIIILHRRGGEGTALWELEFVSIYLFLLVKRSAPRHLAGSSNILVLIRSLSVMLSAGRRNLSKFLAGHSRVCSAVCVACDVMCVRILVSIACVESKQAWTWSKGSENDPKNDSQVGRKDGIIVYVRVCTGYVSSISCVPESILRSKPFTRVVMFHAPITRCTCARRGIHHNLPCKLSPRMFDETPISCPRAFRGTWELASPNDPSHPHALPLYSHDWNFGRW